MPYLRQTNFLGGELDPKLWGRTDLPVFARGLRRCRNFFVSRHGAAVSRPGTVFVDWTSHLGVRLIPFVYSDTVSYVLAFIDSLMVVYKYGVKVATVLSPYLETDDLWKLQWAQTGDVMTLVHPLYAPRELTRIADNNWQFASVSFDVPEGIIVTNAVGVAKPSLQSPLPVADTQHPAREWQWAITEVRRTARGILQESRAVVVTADSAGLALPNAVAVYQDMPVTVNVNQTYAAVDNNYVTLNKDPSFVAFRVYRGRGGFFGWVGDTKVPTFTDVGEEPNYAIAPPQGRNPFKVFDATGALIRTEFPQAVAFFEERRVFAGTTQRPGFLWASATGDYTNFDERLVKADDMPLSFELACRRREEIRSLVSGNKLIALTNASAWALGGAGGEPLSPGSVEARVQDEIGSRYLMPLLVDGSVLFSRAKGSGVRGLSFDFSRGGWAAADLSASAQHLFTGIAPLTAYARLLTSTVIDWCYQEDPWGVVWVVRSDGQLLSLTRTPDGAIAWGRHDFANGQALSVCCVPEGDEDVVYVAMARNAPGTSIGATIEKFASRVRRNTVDDDVAVDCSIKVGPVAPALVVVVSAAYPSVLEGRNVYVISSGNPPYGPLVVQNGKVTLPQLPTANSGANWVGYVGLGFTAELETLDLAQSEARMRQKTVTAVGLEVDNSRGLKVGQDFDNLKEWRQRDVAAGYGPLADTTDLVRMPVKGTWDSHARMALRQDQPLPVTVLGVTREVDVGGD